MSDEIDPSWLPPDPVDPRWSPPSSRPHDRSGTARVTDQGRSARWRWLAVVGGIAVGVVGALVAVKMFDGRPAGGADATSRRTPAAQSTELAPPPAPSAQSTGGASRAGIALKPNSGSDIIVRTASGKTRCVIGSDGVVCQYLLGFPQAPVEPPSNCPPPPGTYLQCTQGAHWDIAVVDEGGGFRWDIGNIPGDQIENDHVMTYGQTYQARGWTILPSIEGTRFTNDRTGHGMFVSIDNVYSF